MARDGGHFGVPFKGYRGVTQGEPLSPTIFNMVVYSVIRYWVVVVALTEVGTEILGLLIQDLEEYFYAKDVLFSSTHP